MSDEPTERGLCPNGCGGPGPHFAPPSMGERGFYICTPREPADEPTKRDVEALLAEHEPVLGRFGGMSGIVGCSCMSARDYRAAGHRAGQGGWRAHVATILAERIAEARREGPETTAQREAEITAAFARGYDKGAAEVVARIEGLCRTVGKVDGGIAGGLPYEAVSVTALRAVLGATLRGDDR